MKYIAIAGFILGLAGSSFALDATLPNGKLTPGSIRVDATKAQLCNSSFKTGPYRNTTESTKNKVYVEYGIDKNKFPCPCEIDHLISLEIGGLDDINDLWPQPYEKKGIVVGAHAKDALEDRLRKQICDGTIELKNAQKCIATNWITCYKRILGPLPIK